MISVFSLMIDVDIMKFKKLLANIIVRYNCSIFFCIPESWRKFYPPKKSAESREIINVETSESMENKTPHTTKSQRYETMLIRDTRIGHKVVLVLIVDPY